MDTYSFGYESTPLFLDDSRHRAHLFDPYMVKFLTYIYVNQTSNVRDVRVTFYLKMKDLVCDESIRWPEC